MGHTFSHTDDQVGEGNVTIHFHHRSTMGLANNDIIRGTGIVGREATLQPRKSFFSHFLS